jgi:hypothetical protein
MKHVSQGQQDKYRPTKYRHKTKGRVTFLALLRATH